ESTTWHRHLADDLFSVTNRLQVQAKLSRRDIGNKPVRQLPDRFVENVRSSPGRASEMARRYSVAPSGARGFVVRNRWFAPPANFHGTSGANHQIALQR